uniref:Uncharacterized protein n=1 Tax=uncultured marine virus TaxID=186617 RepID=A0A0F7L3Z2_9VIRU|nr:hypothetical protein [uncultured marine virus]
MLPRGETALDLLEDRLRHEIGKEHLRRRIGSVRPGEVAPGPLFQQSGTSSALEPAPLAVVTERDGQLAQALVQERVRPRVRCSLFVRRLVRRGTLDGLLRELFGHRRARGRHTRRRHWRPRRYPDGYRRRLRAHWRRRWRRFRLHRARRRIVQLAFHIWQAEDASNHVGECGSVCRGGRLVDFFPAVRVDRNGPRVMLGLATRRVTQKVTRMQRPAFGRFAHQRDQNQPVTPQQRATDRDELLRGAVRIAGVAIPRVLRQNRRIRLRRKQRRIQFVRCRRAHFLALPLMMLIFSPPAVYSTPGTWSGTVSTSPVPMSISSRLSPSMMSRNPVSLRRRSTLSTPATSAASSSLNCSRNQANVRSSFCTLARPFERRHWSRIVVCGSRRLILLVRCSPSPQLRMTGRNRYSARRSFDFARSTS